MRSFPNLLRTAGVGLAVLASMNGIVQAAEVWGPVKSVDTRFRKIMIRHVVVYDRAEFRIGPDTEFRFPDGRILKRVDLESLIDKPVFATVEETGGHYAMKVWVLRGDAPIPAP